MGRRPWTKCLDSSLMAPPPWQLIIQSVEGKRSSIDEKRSLRARRWLAWAMDQPALNAPKERALLELLALQAGRFVTAERLLAGLWGELAPATATKALQTYVVHLRRVLTPGSLVTSGGGYSLSLDRTLVDAVCFDDGVRTGARPARRRRAFSGGHHAG